jgi:ubiquinone/menaquinone biosynthesis C-methylase UbiE
VADVGKHFNEQYNAYLKSVDTNRVLYRNINKVLEPLLDGVVIDVGNGGFFTYDVKKVKKLIAIDVAFKDISRLKKFPNVKYICDDARYLKSIKTASVDVIVFQFVLHHITGKSARETIDDVRKVMKTAKRVLKPGGRVVVIETIVPGFAEFFERVLYRVNNFILGVLHKPMIFLFSRKTMIKIMNRCGFKNRRLKKILYEDKIDILCGLKPNLIVVPSYLAPHRCYFFIANKG